jgi:nucleotide-binding universal stress UspA family protein
MLDWPWRAERGRLEAQKERDMASTKDDVNTHAEGWMRERGQPHVCAGHPAGELGHRLLVPTDLGPASLKVEARAMDIAEKTGASVVFMAPDAAEGDRRLADVVDAASQRGIPAESRTQGGDPVDSILRLAPEVGATGIIVAGDQWEGAMPHPCLCAPLIRLAACPVLVLPS